MPKRTAGLIAAMSVDRDSFIVIVVILGTIGPFLTREINIRLDRRIGSSRVAQDACDMIGALHASRHDSNPRRSGGRISEKEPHIFSPH